MRELDFIIKVYIGEILHEFDSIIDSVGAYVENEKVINTAAGEIIVTVRRSSQYVAGKGIYTKETKTETSDRTIKLPSRSFQVLKEYKVWQIEERLKMGDRWEASDRIFTQCDGKPIHPDSITGWFREFIAKTDLPQITIHSLRHTNITLLIAAGVPLRTVSYRAGHAQTSTTENIYAHAIRTADKIAADALDDILTPKGSLKQLG